MRPTREVNLLLLQRKMDLSRTAQFTKPGEDLTDAFLDTQVGIQIDPNLAIPDVTDRNGNAELATRRLGACGLQHASAQHTEFKLADRSLHAEQQAIVGVTGIIDAILIDHSRFGEAAQLQQMVPIPAIASDPRRLEAKYRSDLASTQPSDKPLESRP